MKMRRHIPQIRIGILTLAFALMSGCVYYNTFFNAKRAFEQAEESREQSDIRATTRSSGGSQTGASARHSARSTQSGGRSRSTTGAQNYRIAIEKSARVIAYYPESDYIDDALLLMAKSYYRLEEYSRALRKCDELLAAFPQSEYVSEAQYWRGLSLWQLARSEEAEQVLREIVDSEDADYRGNAAYALGKLVESYGRTDEAIDLYRVAVSSARDRVFRSKARQALGDALVEAGDARGAIPVYRGLAESARSNEDRYSAFLKIAMVQRDGGKYDDALRTLEPLLADERFTDNVARTQIEIARTDFAAGDVEKSILLYQQIIDDAELQDRSRSSAFGSDDGRERRINYTAEAYEAHYRLGLIQEDHYLNLDRAADLYDVAMRGQAITDSANARKARIDRWKELHTALADTADSSVIAQRPLNAYRIGEHFYFQFHLPDSARYYFRQVAENYGDTDESVRARYALGWVSMEADHDTTAAREFWEEVLADTLQSSAVMAIKDDVRRELGLDPDESQLPGYDEYQDAVGAWYAATEASPEGPPGTLTDSIAVAEWWDQWAEQQRLRAPEYRPLLESVVAQYPESPFAAKARYILAWTAENVEQDSVRAREFYLAVAEDTIQAPDIALRADSVLALRFGKEQIVEEEDASALSDSTITAPEAPDETGIPFGAGEAPPDQAPERDQSRQERLRGRGTPPPRE